MKDLDKKNHLKSELDRHIPPPLRKKSKRRKLTFEQKIDAACLKEFYLMKTKTTTLIYLIASEMLLSRAILH